MQTPRKPIVCLIKYYRRIARMSVILLTFLFMAAAARAQANKYIVAGYVGGFRGLIDVDQIKALNLTHINYAFVDCRDSMAVLTNLKTDSVNFRNLNTLKRENPNLKIAISVGGWSWSNYFSDAVLTPTSRQLFAKSCVDIIRRYDLDGVDIDWEYPSQKGEDNVFRPEDKHNYTLMFEAIRRQLDELSSQTGKKYVLTAAVGGGQSFIDHTEMEQVGKILDYIYVMTYDYSGSNGTVGHHTNLFATRRDPLGSSADKSIRNYLAAGVPAGKLVLGAAFYGKAWLAESAKHHGLGQKRMKNEQGVERLPINGGYSQIKDSLVHKAGYTRHWDHRAKARYLFNRKTRIFVTYDDEKSIKAKCRYVKKHHLAGIFFWEYFRDPKGYLLTEINKDLFK